ncbi:uncharacterized protein LOC113516265 [Galleria mellonella]|uniref:Uncharacterized protein LOC113516265 n=1 Tax=Galleria mellonella TaxID=7137 RepID=A0ABM3MZY9_GALME|nr:uncharacterized protein LOC113516265 [Galleria mellonella]XP_052756913.1 uncharacterized protein LOC113516265 [Galleria mellonella]
MSAVGQQTQQLQQDLQNELTTANQLLHLISIELQQIKYFTRRNGEFEENIKQNASLVMSLASLQQVNVENLPPLTHKEIDMSTNTNISKCVQHETFRNSSGMDDSQ